MENNAMKATAWLILSLTLFLTAGLATPAAARPTHVSCVGDLIDQTVVGDLIVPASEACVLINVTVRGNVRVGERSGLQVIESRVEGGVSGARFEHVSFRDASVGGRIQLSDGVTTEFERSRAEGNVRLIGLHDARLLTTRVQGNLVMRASREVAMLCGTTVEGDARLAEHRGGLFIGDAPIFPGLCSANEVWGTLRVHHNQSDTVVANTTVGRNLICAANEPEPVVYGNQVGGKARGQCGDGEAVDVAELGDIER
jgi:hypothetical protein